jgi:hypothetical protein
MIVLPRGIPRISLIAGMLLLAFSASAAHAQESGGGAPFGDVGGPGQAVAQPPAQCPRVIGCQYAEQNLPVGGYRLQSLQVCGANCTTQYWVSTSADGQQVLEIDPVRGGAILAVARDSGDAPHPAVRVVRSMYAPDDAACCPSGFSDTTYAWDEDSGTLVAGEVAVTPADQFPGYEATRQGLQAEGWIVSTV